MLIRVKEGRTQDTRRTCWYFYEPDKPLIAQREDGPAVIYERGRKEWRIQGKYHRTGGPAIIQPLPEYNQTILLYYEHGRFIREERIQGIMEK